MYEQCKHMIKNIKKTHFLLARLQSLDDNKRVMNITQMKQVIPAVDKTMKIKTILKRHHYGCFDVEDTEGNQFMIQLAHKLEEQWHQDQKDIPTNEEQLIQSIKDGNEFTVHGRPVRLVGKTLFIEVRSGRGRGFSAFTKEDLENVKAPHLS